MSDPASIRRPERGARLIELAGWSFAAMVVLSAHVGLALWLMHKPAIVASDGMPPAAIMIELAPEPEAINTLENEITPDQQNSAASAASVAADAPEEVPEEKPPDERPVEEETARSEPVEDQPVTPPQQAEVVLPAAPPAPPEPKKVERRTEPRKPEPKKPPRQRSQQQAPSQAAIAAQVQVQQSTRNAATATASGVSALSPATWQSRLMAHLERRKRYPASARANGERGTVHVRFSIDDSGNVLSVSLARSSGFSDLDDEVLSLVRRASPVPPPPAGVRRTITAPVRFSAG